LAQFFCRLANEVNIPVDFLESLKKKKIIYESGTRKTISWSVTLYLTKMYPVNTILNAEIEPVQDKKEL
jgi:ABC-type uncharacterized transport system permease subunit